MARSLQVSANHSGAQRSRAPAPAMPLAGACCKFSITFSASLHLSPADWVEKSDCSLVQHKNNALLKTHERLKYKVFVSVLGRRCCTENSHLHRLLMLTLFYIQFWDAEWDCSNCSARCNSAGKTSVDSPPNLNDGFKPKAANPAPISVVRVTQCLTKHLHPQAAKKSIPSSVQKYVLDYTKHCKQFILGCDFLLSRIRLRYIFGSAEKPYRSAIPWSTRP